MKGLDLLEYGGGYFHVRLNGKLIQLRDPRCMHYQDVLLYLQLHHAPGTPDGITEWQRELVFDRWAAAWDLPIFEDARRLAYVTDHHRASIAYDLRSYVQLDLGELWRARKWATLLDIIDRLPGHSQYASAVAMDEEHAELIADAIVARQKNNQGNESIGPALTQWTPEMAVLTSILDAVRGTTHAVIAVQAGKKAPDAPEPEPRPSTPLQRAIKRAEFNSRKSAHESLVARVLPHKAESSG